MGIRGRILRIERSSSYDGEGLRTVVFLKGCPLRCLWCSTPESQRAAPETGVAREKCRRCGQCIKACPAGALSAGKDGFPHNGALCLGCGDCAAKCPAGALCLYGYEAEAEDIVSEIAKDEVFYFHSGGGFTLSGGEALAQPEFALEVFRLCAERGIAGTVETSCAVPWKNIRPLLSRMEVIYVDIKHMDDMEHRRLTGRSNRLILENIRRIDAAGSTKIVVRVPFIPTINDSAANLAAVMNFCSGLDNLREVELLAYHRLGAETYRRLGREIPLPGIKIPEPAEILEKATAMKRVNRSIMVKINGQSV